jgi:hypothetical protein
LLQGKFAGKAAKNPANAALVEAGSRRDFLEGQAFPFEDENLVVIRCRETEHPGPQIVCLCSLTGWGLAGIEYGLPSLVVSRQIDVGSTLSRTAHKPTFCYRHQERPQVVLVVDSTTILAEPTEQLHPHGLDDVD